MERAGLSAGALLPVPPQLREEIERLPDTVRDLPCEQAVRGVVEKLNWRVMEWPPAPSGSRVPLAPVRAEDVVRQWRTHRSAAARRTAADHAARPGEHGRAVPPRRPVVATDHPPAPGIPLDPRDPRDRHT
jgi:hypothetical protein